MRAWEGGADTAPWPRKGVRAMETVQAALVHFVLPDGPESVHGHCRPALVVRDWRDGGANLVVFRDGGNDGGALYEWRTSVPHSRDHQFGSWHVPGECRDAVNAGAPAPVTPPWTE
jgi:hypothetical protein